MNKKILFVLIFTLILGFTCVYANTENDERIRIVLRDCDIKLEYNAEIIDKHNNKIVAKYKNKEIIECYLEKGNEKIDLENASEISYYEPNKIYSVYIDLTDTNNQLDYLDMCNYALYANDKLIEEGQTEASYINNSNNFLGYDIAVSYDRGEKISDKILTFYGETLVYTYILFLCGYMYLKEFGIRHMQGINKHGGLVKKKDIEYCREMPKNISLEIAYSSLYYCSNISNKKLKNGIIGAFLLKWANDDNISIKDNGNNVFSIDLKSGEFEKTNVEQMLYDILKKAAGDNNIIDYDEFKIWAKNNQGKLKYWYKKILSECFIQNLKPYAEAVLGLKKFLLDYSMIDERRHTEVKIWEQYLIYAQLLGISKEVNKEFAKIYPSYSKLDRLMTMSREDWFCMYLHNYIVYGILIGGFAAVLSLILIVPYSIFLHLTYI